jgi:hypothetical protein
LRVSGYGSAADRDSADPEKAVLSGTAGFSVQPGTPVTVAVNLVIAAGSTITGTFHYTIQFPNTVSYGVLTLSDPNGGSTQPRNILGTEGGNTLTTSGSNKIAAGDFSGLPAGYYRLGLELYDGTSSKIARRSEVLHIYGGGTSTAGGAGYTFAAADFADGGVNLVPYTTSLPITLRNILDGPAGEYTVILPEDERCPPMPLTTTGSKEFVINILGNGHTVQFYYDTRESSLFTIGGSSVSWKVTLTLRDITLGGMTGNQSNSLIRVESTGTLIMNNGAVIRGHTAENCNGGGVYVNGGTFTMNGGEISETRAPGGEISGIGAGGGVYVSSGTFTMEGGKISENYAYTGSGVCISGGTFTMSGGEISENISNSSFHTPYGGGGGVSVRGGGIFTMSGGEISNNKAWDDEGGGGVHVSGGTFIMNGGEIPGNTSSYNGGGVHVSGGTFTMSGGKISGNTAGVGSYYGGGVWVSGGTFTMNSGEISGDTYGGVYVSGGDFIMDSGEISGNTHDGVNVTDGDFIMNGGEISGNTGPGSGVYVGSYGTFTMNNGKISGNNYNGVSVAGGTFIMDSGEISGNTHDGVDITLSIILADGVPVDFPGTFTMNGGEISGNTDKGVSINAVPFTMNNGKISRNTGGGVYVTGASLIWGIIPGIFTMSGGEISGNSASKGGGVFISSNGASFTKQSGGIIYGSDESDDALKNTATDGDAYGHAVCVATGSYPSYTYKKRNFTAGIADTMDSTQNGAAGGWE